jgi:hypothetical protein
MTHIDAEAGCAGCTYMSKVSPTIKAHAGLSYDGLCTAPIPTPLREPGSEYVQRGIEVKNSDGKACAARKTKYANR